MMKLFNKTSTWLSVLVALWWCVDLTSAHDAVLYTEHPVDDDENYETYAVYEELTAIQCNVKCAMAPGKCNAIKRKPGKSAGERNCMLMSKRTIASQGMPTGGEQLDDEHPGETSVLEKIKNHEQQLYWSDWSQWESCPLHCNDGKRQERIRACTSLASAGGQSFCFGPESEIQPCTLPLTGVPGYQEVANNICFRGKDEAPAVFTFPLSSACYKIKLQHLSGGIRCSAAAQAYPFGCDWSGHTDVEVSITGIQKSDVLMQSHQFTEKQGYGANVQYIATEECFMLMSDKTYSIWYNEDRLNSIEDNNSGESCVSVHVDDDNC